MNDNQADNQHHSNLFFFGLILNFKSDSYCKIAITISYFSNYAHKNSQLTLTVTESLSPAPVSVSPEQM